jgi:hypothetical protein
MDAAPIALGAYSLLLVAIALGLDRLSRHSHERSGRFRTAGFSYRPHLDAWECPEGEHLHRAELDQVRRLVRYRARAATCNACPAKGACTDSDDGREIVRPIDPWPQSEAGRFHRAISVVLLVLATAAAAGGVVTGRTEVESALIGLCLVLSASVLVRMAASLRATPVSFPGGSEPPSNPVALGR